MVRIYTYLEMYLADLHRSFSLSEFEKHFQLSHQTIKKHLMPLVKANVLREEKRARFLFYSLNTENPLTRDYLLMCEKERLFALLEKSTLLARLYGELAPFFTDSNILVFGSSIGGKAYGDIDLLIISQNKQIKTVLKKFQETYSVKLHIVQTDEKNLTKTFLEELRKKHILFNSHEYFMKELYG